MVKGDGSITKRGPGVYEVAISLGIDPKTGKYQRTSRIVRGTLKEARLVRDELRKEAEEGFDFTKAKVTLSQFLTIWENAKRLAGNASDLTIDRYLVAIRPIVEQLGNVPLSRINARAIESVYAKMKSEKGLSGSTLHKAHTVLSNVFKKACDYEYITKNPCDKVTAPKVSDPERRALSAKEAMRLLDTLNKAEDAAYRELEEKEARQVAWSVAKDRAFMCGLKDISCLVAIRIMLATGLRRGEVLALKWSSIDLEEGCLSVVASMAKDGSIKRPKTKAGYRTIYLDGETLKRLEYWKTRQAEELDKFNVEQSGATPVCCSNIGTHVDPANLTHWWEKFRVAHGFPDLAMHELRHTQATLLLANGVDVKTVQNRLGHANASITLNWYAHAIPENDKKAAQLMGKICNPTAKDSQA